MPSNIRSIRFAPETWALIEREAKAANITAAQFVREAALSRAVINAAVRGEPGILEWKAIADHVTKTIRESGYNPTLDP